ncbi:MULTISPECIES: hypothetical protein [unclassified Actinomyces]|uniref:hypothetical protein n=1 Tax=unclassified Actinomyces TaxID=2609248 RepID=UPI0013A6C44E|nr:MULTISPECIES: hypothetical protein [unclassified Actinomyces]MBW3069352.1 hypothetical protein [Actinomyces sp. 594]NDR53769.1 hypothetical protein [Actinomyces sp. 565]
MTEPRPDDFDVTARIPAEDAPAARAGSALAPVGADAGLTDRCASPEVGGQSTPPADDPEPQAAVPAGASPVSTPGAGTGDRRGRPWYRRGWLAAAAVIALMAASFGAGWGVNELLSGTAPADVEQGEFAPGSGGPGGQAPGRGGGMPDGGQPPYGDSGQTEGGAGGAGRTTPDRDGSGGDGTTSEDGGSAGVLQEGTSA